MLMMLIVSAVQAQEIRLAVWQDARLAIVGDNKGNDAFTVNTLIKLKLQGDQQKIGYMVVAPFWEYADLQVNYNRFGVDLGYTFNQFIWDIEVTPTINYGIIDRAGRGYGVFGADLEASIPIAEGLRVSILGQLVDRADLAVYNDRKIVASGFIGIQHRIFIPKRR